PLVACGRVLEGLDHQILAEPPFDLADRVPGVTDCLVTEKVCVVADPVEWDCLALLGGAGCGGREPAGQEQPQGGTPARGYDHDWRSPAHGKEGIVRGRPNRLPYTIAIPGRRGDCNTSPGAARVL